MVSYRLAFLPFLFNIASNTQSVVTAISPTSSPSTSPSKSPSVSLTTFSPTTSPTPPSSLLTKLTGSEGVPNETFGFFVAVSKNVAVISAHYGDSVYIFELSESGNWEEKAKLTANDGTAGDMFGHGVGISTSSNVVVVGAHGKQAVYIFEKNITSGIWEQTKKLTPSDPANSYYFGYSVAISEDVIVIGCYDTYAYIFERNTANGEWEEKVELTASDGVMGDCFGEAVDISGNIAVIGAPYDDDNGSSSGSVYIFEKSTVNGNWEEISKLTAHDGAMNDYFGDRVVTSGNVIAVSAWHDDLSGSVYTFEKSDISGNWEQTSKLIPNDGSGARFGFGLAISEGIVAVGDDQDDQNDSNKGKVYFFQKDTDSGNWEETATLTGGVIGDRFGASVALSENYVLVGAPYDIDQTGAVYVSPRKSPPTSSSTCLPVANKVKLQSIRGIRIQLMEVEVYSLGQNVALGKAARQDSNYKGSRKFAASKAVDGSEHTFSHTNTRSGCSWWEVDLGGSYEIERVQIINRWCRNKTDPNGCLCRLSYTAISLLDKEGGWVDATITGNTCGELILNVTFNRSYEHCGDDYLA